MMPPFVPTLFPRGPVTARWPALVGDAKLREPRPMHAGL